MLHRRTFRLSVAAGVMTLALTIPALLSAQQVTLIRNANVYTVTNGDLSGTDLLLRDGRIAQIGRNLSAPAGALVIDGTGKSVTPGIIDAHSHMAADAINEGSLSVTSMVRIQDVLNPEAPNLYRAVAGGTTTINVLHGSANTIGGLNAVIKLKVGQPLSKMFFPGAPPGIKFALGENVTRKNSSATGEKRFPWTRMGQEEIIRDAFTRAQNYQAEWSDYRASLARKESNLVAPRRDLELEPLVEILEGKRLVHAHSYRGDEMLMLLNLAREFGFKIATLQHGLEGYKIAPEIAAAGAGLSTFSDFWGYKVEAYDAIPYNAVVVMRAGALASINSDDDGRARRLNIDAAKLVRYGGITHNEALSMITINPARQLQIDKKVGSIEVGKDADLVIWNGDPLSVYSKVLTTFIDGEIVFDVQKDLDQRAADERERAELEKTITERSGGARGGRGGPGGAMMLSRGGNQ